MDLCLHVGGQDVRFALTDGTPGQDLIGRFPGAVADGRWHHAAINLEKHITRAFPDLPVPIAGRLALEDPGHRETPKGARLDLDNLALFSPARPAEIVWELPPDASGISGYACAVDRSPQTRLPERLTRQQSSLTLSAFREPGTFYLHVRAQDGAGNWSEQTTFRFEYPHGDG